MSVTNLLEQPESRAAAEPAAEAPPQSFAGADGMRYVPTLLKDPRQLQAHIDEWESLAALAADPNPFYEPWFFLPAAKHLTEREEWRILLVHRMDAKKPGAAAQLCGFFPFVKSPGALRSKQWSLWKNQFCFLTSPLIDRGCSANVLRTVFQYLRNADTRPCSVEFSMLAAEGPLHHGLTEVLRENLSVAFMSDQYLRAVIQYPQDVDGYLKAAMGGHHVRELRRKRRKLEAQGQIEYRQLRDARNLNTWVDWFLDLEAQGWKARAGTAIRQHPAQTAFFREMVSNGFDQQKVRMEGLFLNGAPIALKCNLLVPPAAFAFKIAFDEQQHACSPGVLLEVESLQNFANDPEIRWSDSCAAPGHQMIDRIWTERRIVRHLIVSTGNCAGDVVIGSLPLMRALNRLRKRWWERLSPGLLNASASRKD